MIAMHLTQAVHGTDNLHCLNLVANLFIFLPHCSRSLPSVKKLPHVTVLDQFLYGQQILILKKMSKSAEKLRDKKIKIQDKLPEIEDWIEKLTSVAEEVCFLVLTTSVQGGIFQCEAVMFLEFGQVLDWLNCNRIGRYHNMFGECSKQVD